MMATSHDDVLACSLIMTSSISICPPIVSSRSEKLLDRLRTRCYESLEAPNPAFSMA